jgi:hypothetical protein
MPTNFLRKAADKRSPLRKGDGRKGRGPRRALLTAAGVSIRVEFADTPTADLIWRALPLHSTGEPWGQSVHFKVPVHAGRDRTAKLNGMKGEIYFWVEDDRVLVPFGPTPISRPGECRLPSPANVWAHTLDDVSAFGRVRPGGKVSLVSV